MTPADFFLSNWEVRLDDHYSKETKLVDLGIGPPFDFSIEYPTATLRDVVKPQHPVKISSDITRLIIHKTKAGLFFTPTHVKDVERELILTSKVRLPFTYLQRVSEFYIPPDFSRNHGSDAARGWVGWALVNPNPTSGTDYAHHITACPPRFENLTSYLD